MLHVIIGFFFGKTESVHMVGRDGVYYMLSITIAITKPSITITFQIFKSITITLSSITSITFYYFVSASK